MTDQPTTPVNKPVSMPARLSVVQTVYFHPANGHNRSEQFDSRYSQWLTADEEPYSRVLNFDDQKWVLLDGGWVGWDRCSTVVIEHLHRYPSNPTPAEEIDNETVDVGITINRDGEVISVMYLRPGCSLRFAPTQDLRFVARCRRGNARCRLTLFPE